MVVPVELSQILTMEK